MRDLAYLMGRRHLVKGPRIDAMFSAGKGKTIINIMQIQVC